MRLPESGDRARHADSQVTEQARARDDVAVLVQVHVAIRREWRRFTVVEETRFAVHVDEHETATADVARFRVGDGQREAGGDRRIDRVAAGSEYRFADLDTVSVGHCDGRRGDGFGGGRLCLRRGFEFGRIGGRAADAENEQAGEKKWRGLQSIHVGFPASVGADCFMSPEDFPPGRVR